jgi:cytochrome c
MKTRFNTLHAATAGIFLIGLASASSVLAQNPCAARANPCAAKNPRAARNPCGATKVDPRLVIRPKGTRLAAGGHAEMLKLGERLFKDTKLSTNGLSCQSCHVNGAAFNASFAKPYPHSVAMAKSQAGISRVTLDEMVQFCLVVPMATKPLPWDSKQLAALTAYTGEVQQQFVKKAAAGMSAGKGANPCAATANPCAAGKAK